MKLALVRKHGAEALLVKAFLAETNIGGGGGGISNGSAGRHGSTNGNGAGGGDGGLGLCTENAMVSLVLLLISTIITML